MSTGGIALVIASTPHRFSGLTTIGTIVFIFDLVLFILITLGISTRFILFRGTLYKSLRHPTESLFFPCFWLSIATIISNIQNYGVEKSGPWLPVALRVLFWLYSSLTFLVAVAQYHILFTEKRLTATSMTPSWILPVFPAMLAGTIASAIASHQPAYHALPIIVGGLAFQGLGFMVSCFMYAIYIGRLITAGLPIPAMRPGMFIAVGPPSFTGLAILGMSSATGNIFPAYTSITNVLEPSRIPDIFRVVALTFAIFLWILAFWFFSISLVAVVTGLRTGKMMFHLSWYCFVFPNVGFTIALIDIGGALESEAIKWVGSVMTVLLVAIWLFVLFNHGRAVLRKEIMWPGRDEDHDD